MDSGRLFQCQGDSSTYIEHLELRVIYLESTTDTSRCPDSRKGQQWTGVPSRSCDVCQTPDRYAKDVNTGNSVDIVNLDNQSSSNETCSSDLQIEFWQPERELGKKVSPKLGKKVSPKKNDVKDLSLLYSKFESLTQSQTWEVLSSCDEDRRQEIVCHLVSGLALPDSNTPSKMLPDSPNPLISTLNRFAVSMKTTASGQANPTDSKNRPFACYRELIFCSMCAVAEITIKSETLYNIMRSVYESDACSERFRALIRGAKWANEAIYHLSRTKYGVRSWDLIYSVERQVDHFTRLNSTIKPDALIAGLDENFFPKESSETSVPFAIPSIIQRIFNYKEPLEDICEVLGYPFDDYQKLELSGLERFLLGTKKRRSYQKTAVSLEDDCTEASAYRSSSTSCSPTPLSPIDHDASTATQGSDTDTPDSNNGITDVNNNDIPRSIMGPFVPPSTTTPQQIEPIQQSQQNQQTKKRKNKKETSSNLSKRQRGHPATPLGDGCVQTPTPPSSDCSSTSKSRTPSNNIEGQFSEQQPCTLPSAASPLSSDITSSNDRILEVRLSSPCQRSQGGNFGSSFTTFNGENQSAGGRPFPQSLLSRPNESPDIDINPGQAQSDTMPPSSASQIPNSSTSDGWAGSSPPPDQEVLRQLFPYDIPHPDSADAYTNQIAPLDISCPGIEDGWAGSSPLPDQEVLRQLFPYEIPHPDSADAYANRIGPRYTSVPNNRNLWEGLSLIPEQGLGLRSFPHNIPQADAFDAYADHISPFEIFGASANNSRPNPLPVAGQKDIPQFLFNSPRSSSLDAYAHQTARNQVTQCSYNSRENAPLVSERVAQQQNSPRAILQADSGDCVGPVRTARVDTHPSSLHSAFMNTVCSNI